jgi:hypothetical protein
MEKGLQVLNVNDLERKVFDYLTMLEHVLLEVRNEHFHGYIRTSAWIEKQTTLLGFLSINLHNDLEEETIDVCFIINTNDKVEIAVDICWSDGEIIKTIMKEEFPFMSWNNTLSELDSYLVRIALEIINGVNSLINQNLPPRYRIQ